MSSAASAECSACMRSRVDRFTQTAMRTDALQGVAPGDVEVAGQRAGDGLAVGRQAAGQRAHLLGVEEVHRLQEQLTENLVPAWPLGCLSTSISPPWHSVCWRNPSRSRRSHFSDHSPGLRQALSRVMFALTLAQWVA